MSSRTAGAAVIIWCSGQDTAMFCARSQIELREGTITMSALVR